MEPITIFTHFISCIRICKFKHNKLLLIYTIQTEPYNKQTMSPLRISNLIIARRHYRELSAYGGIQYFRLFHLLYSRLQV
jgi:hypothetical protein